jgi:hypothetical protein
MSDFAAGVTYVAILPVRSLHGLLLEELFGYQRLKTKPSTTVVMRNADYVRRQAQEIPVLDVLRRSFERCQAHAQADLVEDVESDYVSEPELPLMTPPSSLDKGRASQMKIPILRSDPVRSDPVRSGVTLPSGAFTSGELTEDEGNNNDGGGNTGIVGMDMGNTQGIYN